MTSDPLPYAPPPPRMSKLPKHRYAGFEDDEWCWGCGEDWPCKGYLTEEDNTIFSGQPRKHIATVTGIIKLKESK